MDEKFSLFCCTSLNVLSLLNCSKKSSAKITMEIMRVLSCGIVGLYRYVKPEKSIFCMVFEKVASSLYLSSFMINVPIPSMSFFLVEMFQMSGETFKMK